MADDKVKARSTNPVATPAKTWKAAGIVCRADVVEGQIFASYVAYDVDYVDAMQANVGGIAGVALINRRDVATHHGSQGLLKHLGRGEIHLPGNFHGNTFG